MGGGVRGYFGEYERDNELIMPLMKHIFRFFTRYLNDPKREIKWGSKKLIEKGFVYKYGMKQILDDCVSCARKKGILQKQ